MRTDLLVFVGGLTILAPLAVAAQPSETTAELRQAICRAVDDAAVANHLPPEFLTRILWQESRFQSDATSSAGAEGVAQFMPQTAIERGLVDPRRIRPAIAAAARLLADLTARFGNIGLAAAGYNGGAGRVAKWLHGELRLPAETRRYVLAVTGRTAEAWVHRAGSQPMVGIPGRPCLGVMTELARSVPGRTGGSSREAQLYRLLAHATGLLANLPRRRISAKGEGFRGAQRLCDGIRALGAHCTVYQR